MLNSLSRFPERALVRLCKAQLNYREAKIRAYELPDPLLRLQGGKISNPAGWLQEQRSRITWLFEDHVYGVSPGEFGHLEFIPVRETSILHDSAILKEIDIHVRDKGLGLTIHVLIIIPKSVAKPAPAFLALNFLGNHALYPDSHLSIHSQWQSPTRYSRPKQVLPSPDTRGLDVSRWPIEILLERGYALATAYYGDLEPDFPGGWRHGIRSILPMYADESHEGRPGLSPSQKRPAAGAGPPWARPYHWGAIAAWSWGLRRIMDYLITDPDIRPSQIVLIGHSRLGKAALWAGAQDDRFAIVISNNSGCGGAALFRRRYGETIRLLNRVRPHWFCRNFKKYGGHEQELPIDQHMLIGLIAPRPVYIASASEDLAADPRGEYLSAFEAGKIYALFGQTGLETERMPSLNESVGMTVGYHIRSGPHAITAFDWQKFIRFADRHFGRDSASLE